MNAQKCKAFTNNYKGLPNKLMTTVGVSVATIEGSPRGVGKVDKRTVPLSSF